MAKEITFADPALNLVGAFQTPGGLNAIAQEGDIFHHFVNRPDRDVTGKPVDREIHHARIYREGKNVVYSIAFGSPPPSPVMSKVVGMLPLDMRSKKVLVKNETNGPAKL